MRELPCLHCGVRLKPVYPESSTVNQPFEGTVFRTHGHYGSTVFDEIDGTYLEITICDKCLRTAALQDRVLHGTPGHEVIPPPLIRTWRFWQDELPGDD